MKSSVQTIKLNRRIMPQHGPWARRCQASFAGVRPSFLGFRMIDEIRGQVPLSGKVPVPNPGVLVALPSTLPR